MAQQTDSTQHGDEWQEPNFKLEPGSLVNQVAEATQTLSYAERKELADIMARANLFPGVTDKYKAMAIIEMGQFFGMEPPEALLNIQIGPQGAPQVHYSWQLKRLRQLGHDYEVVEHDHRHAKIELYRKRRGERIATYVIEMSIEQAAKIAIYDKQQGENARLGNKWNWKNYPKSMTLGFCVRNGIRWYFPEVMGGMVESDEAIAQEMAEVGVTEGRPVTSDVAAENAADLFGDAAAPDTHEMPRRDPVDEQLTLLATAEHKYGLRKSDREAYLLDKFGDADVLTRSLEDLTVLVRMVNEAGADAYALPENMALPLDEHAPPQKVQEPY